MKVPVVFSPSPLAASSLEKLSSGGVDEFEVLTLSGLRSLPLPELFIFLRKRIGETIYIVFDDRNSEIMLPIMSLLAALSRAKNIQVFSVDGVHRKIHRISTFFMFAKFIFFSLVELCKLPLTLLEITILNHSKVTNLQETNSTKNLLFLNANLWFGVSIGGSIGHVAGVVNALAKRGWNIHLWSFTENSIVSEEVTFCALPTQEIFFLPAEVNLYHNSKRVYRTLMREQSMEQAAVIYQRLSVGNYSGLLLARKLRKKLIVEYNGSEVWVSKNWGAGLRFPKLALAAETAMLRGADLVVTISDVLAEELRSRGINENKIVNYPNCVDETKFDPALFSDQSIADLRAKYGISKGGIVSLFLGTFGTWHGTEIYARAISILLESHADFVEDHDLYFLFVGDGVKMPHVKSELGIHVDNRRVVFTGLIEQGRTPLFLSSADIFVSPHVPNSDGSKFFGSPTKLFEYMAMERAILASDLGQQGQILKNSMRIDSEGRISSANYNECLALLLEPGSVEALVNGIMVLAADENMRCTLGSNARKEILRNYKWSHHVSAILKKLE